MVDRGSGGVQLGWLKVSQSLVSFYSLKDPLVLGCITMSTIFNFSQEQIVGQRRWECGTAKYTYSLSRETCSLRAGFDRESETISATNLMYTATRAN